VSDPSALKLARARAERWSTSVEGWREHAAEPNPVVEGKLVRATGLTLEAAGCEAAVGERCLVETSAGTMVETRVVGFAHKRLFLMPTQAIGGIMPNARVIPLHSTPTVPVGDALLGRVVDSMGVALDDGGRLRCEDAAPLEATPVNPLSRQPIKQPLDVGVRALNAMLTVGRGQRLGLFAGSGVGKSTLLGMMARYTTADVIVVGLIGERGREVGEFVEENLGELGRARSVVVATPSDSSPLMRLHGAWYATSIAEYFRDRGKHVLFLMDSLTRFAQAQREIGLAVGEPPATKGYPPSVFSLMPQLIERTGNGRADQGSITAFYTVLAEGDDEQDPIVDAARATLDGHVMLSRQIMETGIYPPIDIESSISRSMNKVASPEHLADAQVLRELYSYYMRHRDLITVGAYNRGTDPRLDAAVRLWPRVEAFLSQKIDEPVNSAGSLAALAELAQAIRAEEARGAEAEPGPGTPDAGT
jgi:flagellum-specific ATP synthase